MNKQILTRILFFLSLYCIGTVYHVEASECPTSSKYAIINYDHQLLNQTIGAHIVSEASGLTGQIGIQISAAGVIVNAGNNTINRTIELVYTTSKCDCLSDIARSRVKVTVTGTCTNGVLGMQLHEVYPTSSAIVTCTCDEGGGQYNQPYPGYTNSFNLKMNYVNGNRITVPYTRPDCSGTYSWHLQFTNKPPSPEIFPVVPLISPLLFFSFD
jgi:hypothetical protein